MSICCLYRLCSLPPTFTGYCVYCTTCLTLIVLRNGEWRRG
jgi:hypothetical protein